MANGTTDELVVDTGMAIMAVHKSVARAEKQEALAFRKALIALLTDPDTPIWDLDSSEHETYVDLAEMRRQMGEE